MVKRKRKSSFNKTDLSFKIAEASLKLLKKKSYSSLSINEICKEVKIERNHVIDVLKTKNDIFNLINNYFDKKLIKSALKIEKTNTRDNLFELIMIRFEIYNLHRDAVINIYKYVINKPKMIIHYLPLIFNSVHIISDFSGSTNKSIIENFKIEGLMLIYILVFMTWLNDDSNELEKTMSSLDNYLDNAGKIVSILENRR